ncbi:MAG: glutamine--tRNA ligase/YqeY domain fusion protein [Deltaproteobacteria bacterium]|nr:glutamine--tRNA ligase/YqeY domain fusion protein [Deltaproteobacteria bacterium]
MTERVRHFIRQKIEADNASGKYGGQVITRFPPEPNGYLHIGHAKALCINFGLAEEYGGRCHLRFDDTNPTKEDVEYVEGIKNDIKWLGFDWGEHLYFASDYFEQMAEDARALIRKGLAYVDELSLEEMRAQRGTVTEAGTNSPYRDRPYEESLELFDKMLNGDVAEGSMTLRAKIDMADPNMKMRDPPFYRVMHAEHHQVGDRWKAYPLYDYAHCLEDCYEGVTQSLCSLEFENNRELYNWYLASLGKEHRPEQTEFARLGLTYIVMSKRKLLALVEEGAVVGWDDPRMPTLAGLRRLGVRPQAVREFVEKVGVAKANSTVEYEFFEGLIRKDLEENVPRVMGVVDPVELVIENLPDDHAESFDLSHHPKADLGRRAVPFGKRLWIEREDVALEPPKGWKRLAPGWEVRLYGAYFVTCTGIDVDDDGKVVRVRATYDAATRGGSSPDGRKPKGTIHWVAADGALAVEFRLYDRLFATPDPDAGDWRDNLNPDSLTVTSGYVEPAFGSTAEDVRVQLQRMGYFWRDDDSTADALVLNRIATLRDGWAKAKPAPVKAAPKEKKAPAVSTGPKEAWLSGVEQSLIASAHAAGAHADTAKSIVLNELRRELGGPAVDNLRIEGNELAGLIRLLDEGTINRSAVRPVLEVLLEQPANPADVVAALGLAQVSDTSALSDAVDAALAANPDELARYRGGEKRLMGFFMGQVMRELQGKGDPKAVSAVLREKLG